MDLSQTGGAKMVYGHEASVNIMLFGCFCMVLIAGMIMTIISFIVHRNAHPLAAAILAVIGYLCKLPMYTLMICALPETIFYKNFLMCLVLAAVIVAATGYTVHMILFAIRDNKKQKSEEQNG